MIIVRSASRSPAFVGGRDVDSIVHREDGSSGWVAYVDELRPGDEEITEAEYATEAQAIRDYNAALRAPPPAAPAPDLVTMRAALSDGQVPEYAKALIRRSGVSE